MKEFAMFRSTNNSGLRCVLITLLLTVVCATSSFSQSTGILRGQVTGPDGEGVPGVKIVITGQERPIRTFETETNEEGRYRMMGLRDSPYEVTATTETATAMAVFTIRGGQNLTVDLDLGASAAAATAALSEEDLANEARREELSASFEQGVAASAAGDYVEAIAQFEIAISIVDTCYSCYHNIGLANLELGQMDEAEVAFKQALELRADNAASYTGLAGIYNAQRRFDEAAEMSAEAARLSGGGAGATDPVAVYNQGVIYWNAGNFPMAKEQFEQAVALDPNNADAHYQLAMASLNLGDMTSAVEALEKYIEIAPDGQNADQARGMVQQLKP
jgi:tetratricopeptide (TPR) repeat protein